ncbi:hypothetical protein CALCODRAFT_98273 [Calocera cornea HHB12733]|uniref:Uncharacterized protein n=1 Tax=Calocera cornea HHB12733 TaxID=1353952 RepID=A0A165IKH8_9BASI|nr:hypothetical protein CALCODRAFT_98273 [Calocera cornea HHB12733]
MERQQQMIWCWLPSPIPRSETSGRTTLERRCEIQASFGPQSDTWHLQFICVPPAAFILSLKAWYKSGLTESTCNNLLVRLDEYSVGGITPSSVESFAGGKSLRSVIEAFKKQEHRPSKLLQVPSLPAGSQQPSGREAGTSESSTRARTRSAPAVPASYHLPLIIWVDDEPANNLHKVAFARSLGITVIELSSTALAKAWFDANEAFVRAHDTPNEIRVISDNARYESDTIPFGPHRAVEDTVYLNWSAGEKILRYLRGRRYRMPVLIHCRQPSIDITRYVLLYEQAGSTISIDVVKRYCQALADGRTDDASWKKWGAW